MLRLLPIQCHGKSKSNAEENHSVEKSNDHHDNVGSLSLISVKAKPSASYGNRKYILPVS